MATNFFPPGPGDPFLQRVEKAVEKGTEEANKKLLKLPFSSLQELHTTTVVEDGYEPDDRVRTDVQGPPSMPTTINLFQHPDAHPFVLDLALMRKYGPEWMEWELEILLHKIQQDFRTKSVSDLNLDKVQAVKTLHLVDTFWEEWLVFVPCAMALSGFPAEFRALTALTVPQLMVAVDVAAKLRGDIGYSDEVKTFMETVYLHDGIVCPTAPLDKIVTVDASVFDVDQKAIMERWDGVRASGVAPKGDTVEDVQLQRMLEAHQILEDNRRQTREQLPLIYHD